MTAGVALSRGARVIVAAVASAATPSATETTDTVRIRDHSRRCTSTAREAGTPVIVSSGDGGWIHLGPQVAALLASAGLLSSSAST
jgi:hypothetical protein